MLRLVFFISLHFIICSALSQVNSTYTSIEEAIQDSTKVKILKIDYPIFDKLPNSLIKCKNIEEVSFKYIGKLDQSLKVLSKLPKLKKLSLIDNQIETLPNSLNKLKNLKELNLENNLIKYISNQFDSLLNLESLNLSYNKIDSISTSFYNLAKLKKLNLNQNKISYLSDSIYKLTNLKELEINGNRLQVIPIKFKHLSNLTNVDLSNNRIKNVNSLFYLNKLKEVNVSKNPISEINFNVDLSGLEYLNISNTMIEKLPNFKKSTNLKKLKASFLPLKMQEVNLGELKNIEYLDLRKSNIKSINKSIIFLKKISNLDLSFNPLSEKSTSYIFQIESLKKLKLIECEIVHIKINKISENIIELYLDNNLIESIPKLFYNLEKLEILSLYNNKIEFISKEIIHLKSLIELELGRNNLTILNKHFSLLPKLKTLNVQRNKITNIENFKGEYDSLIEFDLGANLLNEIPDGIFKIKLKEIDISENPLKKLPIEFWTNKSYEEINLSGISTLKFEFTSEMKNLIELDISKINFSEFPHSIDKLPNLKIIEISNNDLINDDLQNYIKTHSQIQVNY